MKRIGILGSTGSIGTNCLQVIESHPDTFQVAYLSTHVNVDRLYDQCLEHRPAAVAISRQDVSETVIDRFTALGVEVCLGVEGLIEIACRNDVDLVVNALVGAVGLKPTLQAIENGRNIALANKETLVMAGEVIMSRALNLGVTIVPVDSEHSAVFQCLVGENRGNIRRLILTASGGPFREMDESHFKEVTVDQALNHPKWNMGQKITIDSATLMNKGLEVIEAHWLFGLPVSRIEVVIHPQSIIHSMVEFIDGSVKAQLSIPDMRIPIQYALTYPERMELSVPYLDFNQLKELTFHPPDMNKFRALALAYEAINSGGTAPAVLNAANEVSVRLFLQKRIRFDQIIGIVEEALSEHELYPHPDIEAILAADKWARDFVEQKFG